MTQKPQKRVNYDSLSHQYDDPGSLVYKKLRIVDSYVTGGKSLLDFGSGTGDFIDFERRKFDNIYGVDSDEGSIEICHNRFKNDVNVQILQNSGDDLANTFDDTKFDYITALDVLEHVQIEESRKLLRSFYFLLDDGGKFIFTGPGIFEKIRIKTGRSPTHVCSHSSYGWAALIRSVGFQIVSIESVEFPVIQSSFLRKRLHLLGKCCVIQAKKN